LASPRKSLRVLSQEIGLSRSTCQRAAKKAALHAYRFRVVQELKQQDYDKRMTYCHWFQTFIDENPGILDYTWFSDEAWLHLSGYVNSQNTRLWGSENPHALFEEPLHSQKVGVFCALSQRRIIGLMFFNTTVTSQVYIEIFREVVN
jgi:DNA-binding transcriptional MocR family regulator